MKTKFATILMCLALALGTFVITGCSGCQSSAKKAYVTSGATHIGVVAALHGWNDYLGMKDREIEAMPDKAAGRKEWEKISDQNAKVSAAYEKYRAAQIALLTATQEFSKIPPNSAEAPAAADRLSAAVAASTATMGSVLALLSEFGIKTN